MCRSSGGLVDVEAFILGMGVASLTLLVLTLVALPFVVAQLPEDYFTRKRHLVAYLRETPAWVLDALRVTAH